MAQLVMTIDSDRIFGARTCQVLRQNSLLVKPLVRLSSVMSGFCHLGITSLDLQRWGRLSGQGGVSHDCWGGAGH